MQGKKDVNKKKYNYKGLLLVVTIGSMLGWFLHLVTNWNNISCVIIILINILMVSLIKDYLVKDGKPIFPKYRHFIFSVIVYIFIIRVILGAFSLCYGLALNHIEIGNSLYLTLLSTTIFLTIAGDWILNKIYPLFGLQQLLIDTTQIFRQDILLMIIYLGYFILIFLEDFNLSPVEAQFVINTLAAYFAFERFWKITKPMLK